MGLAAAAPATAAPAAVGTGLVGPSGSGRTPVATGLVGPSGSGALESGIVFAPGGPVGGAVGGAVGTPLEDGGGVGADGGAGGAGAEGGAPGIGAVEGPPGGSGAVASMVSLGEIGAVEPFGATGPVSSAGALKLIRTVSFRKGTVEVLVEGLAGFSSLILKFKISEPLSRPRIPLCVNSINQIGAQSFR